MNNLATLEPWTAPKSPPDWGAIMQADGDSMAPTIGPGDLVEVDRRVTTVRHDGIYVFTLDGQLYVKSFARAPDGSLNVISHNPACTNFRLSQEEQVRMQVLGRVVKIWNGRRT